MTVSIRGKADEVIDQIDIALRKYAERHPSAHIEMYRKTRFLFDCVSLTRISS